MMKIKAFFISDTSGNRWGEYDLDEYDMQYSGWLLEAHAVGIYPCICQYIDYMYGNKVLDIDYHFVDEDGRIVSKDGGYESIGALIDGNCDMIREAAND